MLKSVVSRARPQTISRVVTSSHLYGNQKLEKSATYDQLT